MCGPGRERGGSLPCLEGRTRRRLLPRAGEPCGGGGGRLRMPCLVQSCRGFSFCLRRVVLFSSSPFLPHKKEEKKGKRPAKWPPRPTDVAGLWPREVKPLQGGMGPLNMETTFLSLSLSQKKRRHGDHLSAATSPVTFSSQQRPSSPVAFFAPRRHSSVSHAH